MHRLINYNIFGVTSFGFSWSRHWRDCVALLCCISLLNFFLNHKDTKAQRFTKALCCLVFFVSLWFNASAQRQDVLLNNNWTTSINNKDWKQVNIPHNWDDYHGYRRLLHGNLHGDAVYKKSISIKQNKTGKRFFLFFEGVGSYATVFLNNKKVGEHSGGRTTFTIDVTDVIETDGTKNELLVNASHPANIKDQPWVCGGCSDERGFSEGSQPMGIFRPVHLVVTNDVRIEPFGVHAWADVKNDAADLWTNTTLKNYSSQSKTVEVISQLKDAAGKLVASFSAKQLIKAKDSVVLLSTAIKVANPKLWSDENPYLYKVVSIIKENNIVIDKVETDFGFRTIKWNNPSHQFTLNGKPVFLNGIAEYEHLLGQSHAFSNEQIDSRIKWIQAAGFNAFRDGHQPHNLLYGKRFNEKGILWWTQLSAHVWYDTKEFRNNFKTLLREWVIERRNDPSVILWGLQNESKLPKDFAEECTALIRSLDPTASTERLVTTCNGGEGTDWDVPQNWTGTYGGNPATYGEDLKKQILVGEYGAWRTIDLHTEGGFNQNGAYSEDRMTLLMEQKIRLAEKVKDSVAGHFMWLLTSHDNPGRVQGGEGVRELDRIGPVNYKGLLTPWEEPTDAFYMYRSNYADKNKEPMVYIVSHTWPNRWMTPGIKSGIIIYSNCDEVELFNDVNGSSLGKRKRNGIGTHFQWDSVDIKYNVLSAVAYNNGLVAATDKIVLNHLQQSPNFKDFRDRYATTLKPKQGYNYVYRINCGGPDYRDEYGNKWETDKNFVSSWTRDFPELPTDFASQRRTFSPIKGTNDWKLFQSFRYGKDKLQYEFDVPNGEYLVELYFIEPWLGIGGGMKATGMRLFDVAVNGIAVLNDLDIWNEVGTNTGLKKTVKAKAVNGKLIISFPESKAGQAVISAIAIARQFIVPKTKARVVAGSLFNDWLDIGDKVFANDKIQINNLPSNLFGAYWVQLNSAEEKRVFEYTAYLPVDLFVAKKKNSSDTFKLKGLENTNSQIVTDENDGTYYSVYRRSLAKGEAVLMNLNSDFIIAMQPANNMQPAYDLKPTTQYKTNIVKLNEGAVKDSVNGRYCAVVKTNNQTIIDYPVQTGVGDRYSVTVKFFYGKEQTIKGKWQLIDAGGNMMQEEPVSFTFTRPGKWNQFTINTSSQINAGNYTVRLIIENGEGLALSGIDVQ
jgi:beta-galactosidase